MAKKSKVVVEVTEEYSAVYPDTTKLFGRPFLPNNCPILERTADNRPVGRCCFHLKDGVCPRHGNVSRYQKHYQETGKLTDENEMRPITLGGRVMPDQSDEPWPDELEKKVLGRRTRVPSYPVSTTPLTLPAFSEEQNRRTEEQLAGRTPQQMIEDDVCNTQPMKVLKPVSMAGAVADPFEEDEDD